MTVNHEWSYYHGQFLVIQHKKKHMILYNHIDPPVLVGSLGFTWLILDTPPLFGKKNESLQVAAGREA